MNSFSTRLSIFIVVCQALFCLGGRPLQAVDLSIKGSDTMLIMNQELAQAYMRENPGVNIQVSGGGSGVGIAALRNNTTDIAAASRLMKPKEVQDFLINLGVSPVKYSVALDGVAMFVNQANPVSALTIDQLGKIFRGDYTNWQQVGGSDLPITVYSRETSSGTYSFVKDEVLKGGDYTPRAQTLPGTAAVYDAVGHDIKGIGYGGIGYDKGVKVLNLRANDNSPEVLPSEQNVDQRIYPLSRTLNYYVNPRSENPEADKFISWTLSPEGQKIVAKTYFALPVTERTLTASNSAAPAQIDTGTATGSGSGQADSSSPQAPAPPSPDMTSGPASGSYSTDVPVPQPSAPLSSPISAPLEATGPLNSLEAREAHVLAREEALAKREEALAQREAAVAEREAKLFDRMQALMQNQSPAVR